MPHSHRGNPDIVRRQRCAGHVFFDRQDVNDRVGQKVVKRRLILVAAFPLPEADREFPQDDDRDSQLIGAIDQIDDLRVAPLEVAVGRRVQADPHRAHMSSSILSKGATAASNRRCWSASHVPESFASPLRRGP